MAHGMELLVWAAVQPVAVGGPRPVSLSPERSTSLLPLPAPGSHQTLPPCTVSGTAAPALAVDSKESKDFKTPLLDTDEAAGPRAVKSSRRLPRLLRVAAALRQLAGHFERAGSEAAVGRAGSVALRDLAGVFERAGKTEPTTNAQKTHAETKSTAETPLESVKKPRTNLPAASRAAASLPAARSSDSSGTTLAVTSSPTPTSASASKFGPLSRRSPSASTFLGSASLPSTPKPLPSSSSKKASAVAGSGLGGAGPTPLSKALLSKAAATTPLECKVVLSRLAEPTTPKAKKAKLADSKESAASIVRTKEKSVTSSSEPSASCSTTTAEATTTSAASLVVGTGKAASSLATASSSATAGSSSSAAAASATAGSSSSATPSRLPPICAVANRAVCRQCPNVVFSSWDGLLVHTKQAHSKAKPPHKGRGDVCPHCMIVMQYDVSRRKHAQPHPHACPYCPARFLKEEALKSHVDFCHVGPIP